MIAAIKESRPCYLHLTKKAQEDIQLLYQKNEQLSDMSIGNKAKHLLSCQDSFQVHIERSTGKTDDECYININFDSSENKALMMYLKDRTLSMYGVVKNDGLLIISVKLLHVGVGQRNNRRVSAKLHFFLGERCEEALPTEMVEAVKVLPVAKEQSKYVQSRLESWNVYLDLIMKRAENENVLMDYSSARLSQNLRNVFITCHDLREIIGKKKLRNAEVKFIWDEDGNELEERVGTVRRFVFEKDVVEVELEEDYVEYARQNKWSPPAKGKVHISNFGDLAQAKRLKKGFIDLQNGVAQNPNLEYLLFDDRPICDTSHNVQGFEFTEAIQNNLNVHQREAVRGALAAEDIYLIQGPPGTGKTTVIAEICYQNAERGLKTLVASQSNLAVDNALSKLLTHPKVRILRKGRTKSIEEEGKKYIEENIAQTWKNQTKQRIANDIKELEKKIQELNNQIQSQQNKRQLNQAKLDLIERYPMIKDRLHHLDSKLRSNQNQLRTLGNNQKQLNQTIADLHLFIQKDTQEVEHIHKKMDEISETNYWERETGRIGEEIEGLKKHIQFYEAQQAFNNSCKEYENIEQRITRYEQKLSQFKQNNHDVRQMTSQQLVDFVEAKQCMNSKEILHLRNQVIRCYKQSERKEKQQKYVTAENETYKDYVSRLQMVMKKQEKILENYQFDTEMIQDLVTRRNLSKEMIDKTVTRLVDYVIHFTYPTFLQNFFAKIRNKRPTQIQTLIQNYTECIELLKVIETEVEKNNQLVVELEEAEHQLPVKTNRLKIEVLEYYENKCNATSKLIKQEKQQLVELKSQIDLSQQDLMELEKEWDVHLQNKSLDEMQDSLKFAEQKLRKFGGTKEAYLQTFVKWAEDKNRACAKNAEKIQEIGRHIQVNEKQMLALQEAIKQIEQERKEYLWNDQFLSNIDIHQEKRLLASDNAEIEKCIEQLNEEVQTIRTDVTFKAEWSNMLDDAKDYDLQEMKKMYIKHANVIGITCVQSASKEFIEDYPDFDVVIIDEVSKATPPELLLPMLKGKKIILVGDHHQLPPLIGQETMDEVIEKIADEQKKEEVKMYLKESLFERLFETLPPECKTTLRTQYRMHADIMETITQFYEDDEAESYGLVCGLANSNLERDHQMNGQYIKRGQHLMWFDIPHEESFYEEQEEGTTSRYNQAELNMIAVLLEDLNTAVDDAKKEGRLKEDEKKKIGLISFYGEQVRKLKHLVDDELSLPHLQLRIGTVDRFQGMESDVIIASFVRNHNNSKDDIGFSNDYRRLNVALSRAKQLLLITGSSKMFTQQAKRGSSRKMYTRVVDTIRQKNGMRDYKGRLK